MTPGVGCDAMLRLLILTMRVFNYDLYACVRACVCSLISVCVILLGYHGDEGKATQRIRQRWVGGRGETRLAITTLNPL